ncbi:encapsulation protein CapA [Clostridium botulinum C str. Eklund]|nr:encapsulation protein CapA [Clostridium botulinum C str. Eklund]NEZ48049.1 CapA family protein [Clostridium botulinum]
MTRKKHRTNKKKFKFRNIIIAIVFLFTMGFLCGNITGRVSSFFSQKQSKNNTNPSSLESSKKDISEANPKVSRQASSNKDYKEILLSAVGDCTLGRDDKYSYESSLPQVLKQNNNNYSYIFKNVSSIFKNSDISICNFEGTLTTSTSKASKRFTFKAPLDYAKILTAGNIDGVNLSNNHTMDYMQQGFEDTKKALKNENINFFGGDNVWIKEVKGMNLGFLGYKGFSDTPDLLGKIKNHVTNLKKQNCIVIINFHWGVEGNYTPNEVQKHIAHYSIDNGAYLIIGHHPHVLQSIEKYKNKLIFYSLGNFAFGGNKNPKDKDSMIAQVKFKITNNTLSSYDFRILPCKISSVNYKNDYCPTPADEDQKSSIINKINNLSHRIDPNIDISDTFKSVSIE